MLAGGGKRQGCCIIFEGYHRNCGGGEDACGRAGAQKKVGHLSLLFEFFRVSPMVSPFPL